MLCEFRKSVLFPVVQTSVLGCSGHFWLGGKGVAKEALGRAQSSGAQGMRPESHWVGLEDAWILHRLPLQPVRWSTLCIQWRSRNKVGKSVLSNINSLIKEPESCYRVAVYLNTPTCTHVCICMYVYTYINTYTYWVALGWSVTCPAQSPERQPFMKLFIHQDIFWFSMVWLNSFLAQNQIVYHSIVLKLYFNMIAVFCLFVSFNRYLFLLFL